MRKIMAQWVCHSYALTVSFHSFDNARKSSFKSKEKDMKNLRNGYTHVRRNKKNKVLFCL